MSLVLHCHSVALIVYFGCHELASIKFSSSTLFPLCLSFIFFSSSLDFHFLLLAFSHFFFFFPSLITSELYFTPWPALLSTHIHFVVAFAPSASFLALHLPTKNIPSILLFSSSLQLKSLYSQVCAHCVLSSPIALALYSSRKIQMDEKALKEAWDWLDDDFRLDAESPLVISQSLCYNFSQNESVVRSLFASTPESHIKDSLSTAFGFDTQDGPQTSCSWHQTGEGSPPLKKGRMLQFSEEHIDISPFLWEPLENCSDFIMEACDDIQAQGPSSSSSMWFMANEESLSSVDDAVEQSAESWMVGCFSDSDAKEAQDISCHRNPLNFGVSHTAETRTKEAVSKAKEAYKCTPIEANPSPRYAKPKQFDTRGKLPTKRSAQSKSQAVKEKPVAYPFALVKPSGIQGDITLKDINERIMAPPVKTGAVRMRDLSRNSAISSPAISGKSVVALTKIHTEGKGTITIMRTRTT